MPRLSSQLGKILRMEKSAQKQTRSKISPSPSNQRSCLKIRTKSAQSSARQRSRTRRKKTNKAILPHMAQKSLLSYNVMEMSHPEKNRKIAMDRQLSTLTITMLRKISSKEYRSILRLIDLQDLLKKKKKNLRKVMSMRISAQTFRQETNMASRYPKMLKHARSSQREMMTLDCKSQRVMTQNQIGRSSQACLEANLEAVTTIHLSKRIKVISLNNVPRIERKGQSERDRDRSNVKASSFKANKEVGNL